LGIVIDTSADFKIGAAGKNVLQYFLGN